MFHVACTHPVNKWAGGRGSRREEGGDHRKATQAPHFDLSCFIFFCSSFSDSAGDWRIADCVSLICLSFCFALFSIFVFLWRSFSIHFLCCRIIDCIVVTFESAMCDDSWTLNPLPSKSKYGKQVYSIIPTGTYRTTRMIRRYM